MDKQETKLFTVVKWGVALALAWAISPFIMGAVKGIVGLLIAAAVGFAAIQLWPLFQFTIKSSVIGLFKWRARADPIGSAQTVHLEHKDELRKFQEDTVQIETENANYERTVRELQRDYPDDPETKDHESTLQMLKDTVAQRREDEAMFAEALTNEANGIKKMEAMWKASQAANKAAKRAQMSKKDYQDLVTKTAFDTVQRSMDEARARLAASTARAKEQRAALPPKAVRAQIIDVTPAKVPVTRS